MLDTVRFAILPWFINFEGCPRDNRGAYCYVDSIGVVTVGLGFAIFSQAAAVGYPWRGVDGQLAPLDLVTKEYAGLKLLGNADKHSAPSFAALTTMRLPYTDVVKRFWNNIHWYEIQVTSFFPDYATWPAGAQMALLDMAWAMGVHFPNMYPKFTAFMRAKDWQAAAEECTARGEPPPRKKARIKLLTDATIASNLVPWEQPK